MKNDKKLSRERARALLAKGDADFRKSALYHYIVKEQKAAPPLDKVLKITSKIPGSLSAEVVAERKKGKG